MRHAALRTACLLPATLAVVTAAAGPARGAAPTVDFLYPAGGRQGTTVALTAGATKADAKIDGWPARAVGDVPGLTFEAGKENGKFAVTIAPDAPVGPHLVRVANADGSSDLRPFYVGRHAEQAEPEPPAGKPAKGEPDGPVPVTALPAVLNGRLAKTGESDAWAVDVTTPGRWLVAELTCRRLGSPVDPLLQLIDPEGTVVAFNHDTFGLDPLLAYRPTRPGRYTLVVAGFAHPPAAEVKFAGSRAAVYRLTVTDGPYARQAFPAVVPRGTKSAVRLLGWNLPGGRGAEPDARAVAGDAADAAGDRHDPGVPAEVDARGFSADAALAPVAGVPLDNEFQVRLSDLTAAPAARRSAAASPAGPMPLPPLPAAFDGRLGRPGAVDRFTLVAKKDDRLTASVVARAVYSPIDPVLTVTGPMGAELARNDDQANDKLDPRVEWTAPHDGTYTVAVADLARRGGPGCVYRLEVVGRPTPSFAATVDDHDRAVAAGKAVELKVTVARTGGYDKPLTVRVANLPPGVTADPVDVPAKEGTATVKLTAAADAPPGGYPFRLVVAGEADGTTTERPVTFALPADVVPATALTLWLTVTAPAGK